LFFCVILLFTVFENFSAGIRVNISQDTIKTNMSENIFLEVTPIEKNDYSLVTNSNPVVNITFPKNGSYLPTPYLDVLGYAYSSDGLNFMEIYYYWNIYLSDYENGTFNVSYALTFEIHISILQPGAYKVVVRFFDIYNTNGSDSVTVYYGENQPPEKPDKPSGLETGSIGVSYSYSTNSIDHNNDKIKYGWDWNGDGTADHWSSLSNSGTTINTPHTFTSTGTYNIKVIAEDEHGLQSSFSEALPVTITSNPLNKPVTPTGEASGKIGVSCIYQSSTIDLDGDQIYYLFNWGDGTDTGWIGPYDSGDICQESHIWNTKGSDGVKVKAKDTFGTESTWSDSLPITMSYSYLKMTLGFLEELFKRFPHVFPILRQLQLD
jgi:hypothetical protein